MEVKETTPITSGSEGAGDKKGLEQKRKIGGKFNSIEEAVENLISSKDDAYHETREELSAVRQLLERALTPIGQNGGNNNYDQGYNRGRQVDDEDEIDTAEFLSNPRKILRSREDKIRRELQAQYNQSVSNAVGNAAVVLRFQMKNADLDEHEDLVESFLRKTDSRQPLNKRLNEAGKATRQYLAKIKGKSNNDEDDEGDAGRTTDSDEYVEGAARGDQGNSRRREANDDEGGGNKETSPDSLLADAITEAKAFRISRFQAPQKK